MISYRDLFDFSDKRELDKAIKLIKNFDKVYDRFISGLGKTSSQYKKSVGVIVASTKELNTTISKLSPAQEKHREELNKASQTAELASKKYTDLKGKIVALEGTINQVTKEKAAFNSKMKETIRLEKEEQKLKGKLVSLNKSEAKEVAKLRTQIQERNKALKQSAKESLGLISIYQKETARLIDLRKRYKDVALSQGQNSREARKLQKELGTLDARLKKVDASAGQFQRSVGNYPSAFRGAAAGARQLATALGFTGVIFGLVAAFRNAFRTIRTFQKQNAVLAGVLDKTRKQVKPLTEDAKRLGATTAKTATEVTSLQIAYARLGFTQSEILALTEDTINGSIALNAELAETAELTGAMVRTFDDLGTTDAATILDEMTAATQQSALTFEKLQTGLPIVAGAANAAGISFTKLLALLGKLSDAGIDASMSATALRNIFIISASQGLNYEQILTRIGNSQDKLTAANDAFGRRAAVSSAILGNLVEEVNNFDESLQNAGGTAERVAAEQLATLDGKLKLLASAWQGLILSIEEGEGGLSRFFSNFFEGLTETLNAVTALNDGLITMQEFLTLSDVELKLKLRNIALEEQAKKQRINNEAQKLFNEAVEEGISSWEQYQALTGDTLESNIDKTKELTDEQREFIESIAQLRGELAPLNATWEDYEKIVGKAIQKSQEEIDLLTEIQRLYNESLEGTISESTKLNTAQIRTIKIYRELIDESRDLKTALTPKEIKKLATAYKEVNPALKETKLKLVDIKESAKLVRDEMGDKLVRSTKSLGSEYERLINSGGETTEMLVEQTDAMESGSSVADKFKEKMKNIGLAIQTAFRGASIAVSQFFENQAIKRENEFKVFEDQQNEELKKLQEQKDQEIALAGSSANARQGIDKKYEASVLKIEKNIEDERKKLQRRQAQNQKKARIFETIINTASAVVEALPNVPLSIATGVLGAIQLAAIISAPIPAFAGGTESAPGGLALVGEKGREMILSPKGNVTVTSNRPELRDVPEGSQVLTNAITENILRNKAANNESSYNIQKVIKAERASMMGVQMKQFFVNENDGLINGFKNALSGVEIHQWHMGRNGIRKDVRKGNTIYKDVQQENSF